jgi:hypothetical protein
MTTGTVDCLTVLTSTLQKLATKRIVAPRLGAPPDIENYPRGSTYFSIAETPVSGFDELAAALAELQAKPYSFVVRGRPLDGIDWQRALRRTGGRAEPAGHAGTCGAALDHNRSGLDTMPAGIDPLFEPDRVVEHAVELLPAEFHGCTRFWSFTGSHGIKPGIRLRLWFWADRPVEDRELKVWLRDSPVDLSLYSPAQPTYTAAPIFVGMRDPVPYRYGTWTGYSDTVTPPAIERPQARAASSGGTAGAAGLGGGYGYHRARIGDHEGGGGFYGPLKGAIGAFFLENGAQGDAEWLRSDLEDAIRSAHRDPGKHDDAYVEDRVADLDPGSIGSASARPKAAEAEAEAAEPIEPTYPAPFGSVAEARSLTSGYRHSPVRSGPTAERSTR